MFAAEYLFEWIVLGIQALRLQFRWKESRRWPTTTGIVQRYRVEKGYGLWARDSYRSILSYTFNANGSPRHVGWFAFRAEHEDIAERFQQEAEGAKVTVRYNPNNPDISLLDDDQILGRPFTQNPHWLP